MSQSKTLYFNFNQEAANSRMRQVVRGKMNVITENFVLSVRATDYWNIICSLKNLDFLVRTSAKEATTFLRGVTRDRNTIISNLLGIVGFVTGTRRKKHKEKKTWNMIDHRSYIHSFSSCEIKAWKKKFRPELDLKRYHCSALPAEQITN